MTPPAPSSLQTVKKKSDVQNSNNKQRKHKTQYKLNEGGAGGGAGGKRCHTSNS